MRSVTHEVAGLRCHHCHRPFGLRRQLGKDAERIMEKQFVLGLMLLSLGLFLGGRTFSLDLILLGFSAFFSAFAASVFSSPGPLASLSWTPFERLRSLNLTGLK